jgi:autotransporter-associated beta strand protein
MSRTPHREAAGLSSRTRTRALVLVAGAALSTAAVVQPAAAQISTWANNVNGTTLNWSAAGSWASGVPSSGTDTALVFNCDFGSTAQTAKDDIAGVFTLNSLTVNSDSAAGGSGAFTFSASTSAGGLSFTNSSLGAGPSINLMGNQAAQFSSTAPTVPIQLLAPLTFTGSGFGNLTMGTVISGNSGVNFNVTGLGALIIGGSSTSNTFTGAVAFNSGDVVVACPQPFGNTSNQITVNGGRIRYSSSGTIAQNIALNAPLNLTSASNFGTNLTITGAIADGSSSNGVSFRPLSASGVVLQGSNTFTGAYFAQSQGFVQNNTGLTTLSGANGAMLNVSSVTMTDNQELLLDNGTAVNSNRLNDSAPIALNRGTLEIRSNLNTGTVENVGAITFTGGSTLMANSWGFAATANSTLNAASLTRSSRGTLIVQGSNLGTASIGANNPSQTGNVVVGAGPALVGGGGASGSTNVSIVPFAFAYNGVMAGSTNQPIGGQLTTYDPTLGFRALTAAEYAPTYQAQGSTSSNNLRSATAVIGGSTQANAVVVDTSYGSSSSTPMGSGLYLKPGSVLTPTSGVLLCSFQGVNSAAPSASTIPSIVAGGTLNFGAAEGIVHTQNNLAILTTISGSQGLTKGGNANLILASGNTFTGPVTINSGIVAIDADSGLGDSSNSVNLAGGAFSGLTFAPSVLLGTSVPTGTPQSFTISRSINLVGAGGGLAAFNTNNTLIASGVISGSGSLYAGSGSVGIGVLKLSGINTYTGPTVVFTGLAVNNDQNLGLGSDIIMDAGFLRNDGTLTTSRNVTVAGSSMLLTNADATYSGVIKNQGNQATLTLTKGGTGNLTLTAGSPFNGNVQIGQPAPASSGSLAGGQSSYVTGGTLTLSGAGALPSVPLISVAGSSTLTLDNTGTNVSNRISANLNIGGGTLNFLGNASAASTETIGTLTFTNLNNTAGSNGTAVVNVSPGSGQSAVLRVSDLSRGANNTLLVRGTNLGGAPGADTANLMVNTATTGALSSTTNFTNGCIGGVVVDTSLTGNGSDLANYGANGVVAATYGANDTFGATVNSNLTVNNVLAAATAANAIRISEGGGIDVNGKILTMGIPATILAIGPTPKTIAATGGGSIAFPASSTATIWNNSDLTVNAPMTGLTGLNKSGTGTLTLNATSAGTTTVVSDGTLRLGAGNLLPAAVSVVLGSQDGSVSTLDLNSNALSIGTLSGIGNVINNNGGLTTSGSSNAFAGAISGTGGLTLNGGAAVLIGGNSTYTGDTVVKNGASLTIGADQGVGSGPLGSGGNLVVGDTASNTSGTVAVQANVSVINKNLVFPSTTAATVPAISTTLGNSVVFNGTVTMGRDVKLSSLNTSQTFPFTGRTETFTGTIQDQDATHLGTFNWAGGSVNLLGNNTFSGGVIAAPGASNPETCFLGIGNNNALGTGRIRAGAAGGNLVALSGARTINNDLYWTVAGSLSAPTRFGFAGTNDLTLNGQIDLGGGAFAGATPASVVGFRDFNVINAGVTTLANTISGQSGSTLTKDGGGKLVMSGTNTFAGPVTVNAGTLLVNGGNGGAGGYTVNSGAILGGTGTIAGPVSVAAGGIIEPGASAGTLTAGALSLVAGSTMTYELDAPNTVGGGVNDLVALTNANGGTGNLTLPASGVVVNIVGLPGFNLQPGGTTYTLMTYTGTLTGSAASFQLGFAPSFVTGATFDTTSQPGAVLITVVPTPGSFGVLGMAGLLAARRRRR